MTTNLAPVRARTLLELQEKFALAASSNGKKLPAALLTCNAPHCERPNPCMRPSETTIIVLDEFRCAACFAKLVRWQPGAFGVPEKPTDAEIANLIAPYTLSDPTAKPFAANLFQLKQPPRFLLI